MDIIRDERNKPLFIVGAIFLAVFLLMAGIKFVFFHEDTRENMTSIVLSDKKDKTEQNKWVFDRTVIQLNEWSWDKRDERAEMTIRELYMMNSSKDFSIQIFDQDSNELKTEIIERKTREEEVGGMILQTDFTVRFDMPDDTYYIRAVIIKGNTSQDFTIDYRDFKKANLQG